MLRRENFYEIFLSTAKSYFKSFTSNESKIFLEYSDRKSNLFLYSDLNVIISKHPDAKIKKFLEVEYDISKPIWKRLLVKLYLKLVLKSKGLLADRKLLLTGSDLDIYSLMILPCNRKIRFFYFSKGYVDVVLKEGFPTKFIRREIKIRTLLATKFDINPLVAHGKHWYREAILDGYPLARVTNSQKKKLFLEVIETQLLELQKTKVRKIDFRKYVFAIADSICFKNRRMHGKKGFSEHFEIVDFVEKICSLVDTLEVKSFKIPYVPSHGDLQEGNIWILNGSEKILFIDWETFGKRSAWYDQFTLFLKLRRKSGFLKSLENFIENGIPALRSGEYSINCKLKELRKLMIIVFIMEDISWELEETFNLYGSNIGFGLQYYLNNLAKLVSLLSK
jgi:hypothetical protein